MTEKNILAYFKSPEEAEQAAKELSALGVVDMSIDRISRYAGVGTEGMMNTLGGEIPSLASTVLNADVSSRDAAILLAADVNASGISDGGQDDVTGRDILLTVVVEEPKHHQALQLVERFGGIE